MTKRCSTWIRPWHDAFIKQFLSNNDSSISCNTIAKKVLKSKKKFLSCPSDLCVLPNGILVLTDTGNHRICINNPSKDEIFILAGSGKKGHRDGSGYTALFAFPADELKKTKQKFKRNSIPQVQVTTIAGVPGNPGFTNGAALVESTFNYPYGLCIDWEGSIFISDCNNHAIRRLYAEDKGSILNRVETYAGGKHGWKDGTCLDSSFNFPAGIAVQMDGVVFVADSNNHCIRRINYNDRMVTTYAGSASYPDIIDGPSFAARFNHPIMLQSLKDGSLLVADRDNATVRLVLPSKQVITIFTGSNLKSSRNGSKVLTRTRKAIGVGKKVSISKKIFFSKPNAIVIDVNRDCLYVVDSQKHCVFSLTRKKRSSDNDKNTTIGQGGEIIPDNSNNNINNNDVDSNVSVYTDQYESLSSMSDRALKELFNPKLQFRASSDPRISDAGVRLIETLIQRTSMGTAVRHARGPRNPSREADSNFNRGQSHSRGTGFPRMISSHLSRDPLSDVSTPPSGHYVRVSSEESSADHDAAVAIRNARRDELATNLSSLGFGFSKEMCRQALIRNADNPDAACEWMMMGGPEVDAVRVRVDMKESADRAIRESAESTVKESETKTKTDTDTEENTETKTKSDNTVTEENTETKTKSDNTDAKENTETKTKSDDTDTKENTETKTKSDNTDTKENTETKTGGETKANMTNTASDSSIEPIIASGNMASTSIQNLVTENIDDVSSDLSSVTVSTERDLPSVTVAAEHDTKTKSPSSNDHESTVMFTTPNTSEACTPTESPVIFLYSPVDQYLKEHRTLPATKSEAGIQSTENTISNNNNVQIKTNNIDLISSENVKVNNIDLISSENVKVSVDNITRKAVSAASNSRSNIDVLHPSHLPPPPLIFKGYQNIEMTKHIPDDSPAVQLIDTSVHLRGSCDISSEPMFVWTKSLGGSSIEISDDLLSATSLSSSRSIVLGSRGFDRGIHYWEIKIDKCDFGTAFIGVAEKTASWQLSSWRDYGFVNYRCKYNRTGEHLYGKFYSAGDTVGVLLDMNKGTISYTKLGHGMSLGRHALINMGVADTHIRTGTSSNSWRNKSRLSCKLFPCVGFAQVGHRATLKNCNWLSLPGQRPRSLIQSLWEAAALTYQWDRRESIGEITYQFSDSKSELDLSSPVEVKSTDKEKISNKLTKRFLSPTLTESFIKEAYIRWQRWVGQRWKRTRTLSGGSIMIDTDPAECVRVSRGRLRIGDLVKIPRADTVVIGTYRGCIWFTAVNSVPALVDCEDWAWYWTPRQIIEGLKSEDLRIIVKDEDQKKKESSSKSSDDSSNDNEEENSQDNGSIPNNVLIDASHSCQDESSQSTTSINSNTTDDESTVTNDEEETTIELVSTEMKSNDEDLYTAIALARKERLEASSLSEFKNVLLGSGPIGPNGSCKNQWTDHEDSTLVTLINKACNDEGVDASNLTLQFLRGDAANSNDNIVGAKVDRGRETLLERHSQIDIEARFALLLVLNDRWALGLPLIDFKASRFNELPLQSDYQSPTTMLSSTMIHPARVMFGGIQCFSAIGRAVTFHRNLIFTRTKLLLWHDVIDATTVATTPPQDEWERPNQIPEITVNRISANALTLGRLPFNKRISRTVFGQLMQSLSSQSVKLLRRSFSHVSDAGQHRAFFLNFEGEGVLDHGGPYRAIFQIMCDEACGVLRLLELVPNGRNRTGSNRDKFLFSSQQNPSKDILDSISKNSSRSNTPVSILHEVTSINTPNLTIDASPSDSTVSKSPKGVPLLDQIRFLGALVALGHRHRMMVSLNFASLVWRSLVWLPITEDDLSASDYPLVAALRRVRHIAAPYDDVDEDITDTMYQLLGSDYPEVVSEICGREISTTCLERDSDDELVYTPATFQNRHKFVRAIMRRRLRSQEEQIAAFSEGLSISMPIELLPIFTSEEAERLICGVPRIDIELLRKVTQYEEGVDSQASHVKFFWTVLEEMSHEERAKFIQFTWARSRLPISADNFSMPFKITNPTAAARNQPDLHLPTSQTCFFSLSLPPYTSLEICRAKLIYAINNSPTMDADVIERSAGGFEEV